MAKVSTYLNFTGQTEEAFTFYKKVFKGEFIGPIHRFSEAPPYPGQPDLTTQEKNMVLNMALSITGGHVLLGSDCPDSMGMKLVQGNSVYINLEPDTRAEADHLFKGLSEGGKVEMPMADMFWGAYFGSFKDKYGTCWMINCMSKT